MEAWTQLLAILGGAVGVYAGIRADLARIHERVEVALKAVERAHVRIDDLIMKGERNG
jgi:hypothetical protein